MEINNVRGNDNGFQLKIHLVSFENSACNLTITTHELL